MGKFRVFAILFGVFFFEGTLLEVKYLKPDHVHAAEVASTGMGTLPPSLFDKTLPPAWEANRGQQMANIFTSCSNFQVPMQNAMSAIGSSMIRPGMPGGAGGMGGVGGGPVCPFAAAVTLDTVCPGTDQPVDISMIDCTMILYGNTQAMEQAQMALDATMCTLQCKRGKAQAIQGELRCITQQAQAMQQQVGSLNGLFQQNVMRMQQDVQTIKTIQEDRKAQYEDVNLKLNGDPASKSSGLLALQQQTKALVMQMPTEIQAMRSMMQRNDQLQKSLDEQIQVRKMALSMECFNTRAQDNMRCSPNGPPVTPKEYLLCRYEQTQNLGQGGVVERSVTAGAQAKAGTQGLQTLLDQIGADAASDSKIPGTPEESMKNSQQPLLVLTAADVERRYGARLRQYKIGGTSAGQFVMNQLKSCERRSAQTVNREQTRANTPIGQALFNIREQKQGFNQEVLKLMSKYNQQHSDNMRGLTGENFPLNTRACTNAPANQQIRCLDQIRVNMEGVLMGNIPQSSMKVMIKGNNPQTFVNFECKGINGCVTAMQNVSTNLKVEQGKIEAFKKLYVLRANQSTQSFTQEIAGQMNVQSQLLATKMQSLNTALSSLGQAGLFVPPMKGEALQFDADGLVKPPSNALGLIAQYVNPPLPDFNSGGFAGALGNIGGMEANITGKFAQVEAARMKLANLGPSCQAQRSQQFMSTLETQAANLSDCYNSELCSSSRSGATTAAMMAAVNRLGSQPSAMTNPGAIASLQSGVSTFCQNPYKTPGEEERNRGFNQNLGSSTARCQAFHSSLISADKNLGSVGGAGTYNPTSGRAQ